MYITAQEYRAYNSALYALLLPKSICLQLGIKGSLPFLIRLVWRKLYVILKRRPICRNDQVPHSVIFVTGHTAVCVCHGDDTVQRIVLVLGHAAQGVGDGASASVTVLTFPAKS